MPTFSVRSDTPAMLMTLSLFSISQTLMLLLEFSACLANILSWMAADQLKLNLSKTVLLNIPKDASRCKDVLICLGCSQRTYSIQLEGITGVEFRALYRPLELFQSVVSSPQTFAHKVHIKNITPNS